MEKDHFKVSCYFKLPHVATRLNHPSLCDLKLPWQQATIMLHIVNKCDGRFLTVECLDVICSKYRVALFHVVRTPISAAKRETECLSLTHKLLLHYTHISEVDLSSDTLTEYLTCRRVCKLCVGPTSCTSTTRAVAVPLHPHPQPPGEKSGKRRRREERGGEGRDEESGGQGKGKEREKEGGGGGR